MSTKQNPSDRILVEKYNSGDRSVLPILVRRWHKIFCEKAFWITRNKETAKDVAQDSWLTIIDKLNTLKNADSFKSWALRIVYTKAIDFVNKKKKESNRMKSINANIDDEDSKDGDRIHIKKALLKAIHQLPKEKQDVIRLFYVEEYSLGEISSFLGIPQGTVKSRLFKAREKLKSLLKKINYEK